MPIRVAIVDDQPIIRSGLNAFINSAPELQFVGEAVNGEDAVQLCDLVQPDVVVMDLKMPVMDGIQATRLICERWPNTRVLILSNFFENELVQSALNAGAGGYLIKDITAEELTAAIRRAVYERIPVTPQLMAEGEISLSQIRSELDDDRLDPAKLAHALRKHLPGVLPDCRIEARIFPDKELLIFPADGMRETSAICWHWLQTQTDVSVVSTGAACPWETDRSNDGEMILVPLPADVGFTVGGMVVRPGGADDRLEALLTVISGLRPWLGRAMSRALQRSNQVVSQNVADQLAAAAQIQIDLLPSQMPSLPGWDLAARLEPALETSGDFYDILALPNNHWGLVIADVSDKGMGAALFMALSSTLTRTYARQYPTLPALAITTVNQRILTDSRSGMFVTAFYAVLEPNTGRLRYVNAGHNPPLLISNQRSKRIDRLQSTGMALGVEEDQIWRQKVTRMLPGDLLVMYTDGVTDAQNESGDYYGEQRLLNVVRGCDCPAKETLDMIIEDLERFTGGMPQVDDITLLVIRRR